MVVVSGTTVVVVVSGTTVVVVVVEVERFSGASTALLSVPQKLKIRMIRTNFKYFITLIYTY